MESCWLSKFRWEILGFQKFLVETRVPGIGILVFRVGILSLKITAVIDCSFLEHRHSRSLLCGSRSESSDLSLYPKKYTARVISEVELLMFLVGIHGWSWNSEVQDQGTSVAFMIGILAGTFGTLVFRVRTLVSNLLFVGLIPCMCHYHSSFTFLAEFLKKCKPQKVPKR